MSIIKRVAYLKGLAEGLELGQHTKEEKILAVIIDILEDISADLEDVKSDVLTLDDDIERLSEEMHDLEDALLDAEEEELEESEPQFFELSCPSCHNEITVDADMLHLGAISCPGCNETLEFDLEGDEAGCGHCSAEA